MADKVSRKLDPYDSVTLQLAVVFDGSDAVSFHAPEVHCIC